MDLFAPALLALLLADTLRLRARAVGLAALPADGEGPDDDVVVLLPAGATLRADQRRAAAAWMRQRQLHLLDLWPTTLSADLALDLLAAEDPRAPGPSEKKPLHGLVSARRAVVVARGLAARLEPGAPAPGPEELARLCSDLSLVEGVRSGVALLSEEGPLIEGSRFDTRAVGPGMRVLWLGLLASVLAQHPVTGLLLFVAWMLRPGVVFGETALRPADLLWEVGARPARELLRLLREHRRPLDEDPVERARPRYAPGLAAGVDRFLLPRRPDCPLCGSGDLTVAVRSKDMLSFKPGRFTVERCGACGHLFQNPRLSVEGLSWYYGDFYEGLGERGARIALSVNPDLHVARAQMLVGRAEPKRWLDVGGAYGLSGKMGRRVFPDCVFDGLDSAQGIAGAARRGWFSEVTVGFFPDCVAGMAGRYDVVSMSHYLEHTLDPAAELDAARTALRPGGFLLIEVPDPASIPSRLLGRYYLPWFQPQHLHFLSVQNLGRLLQERGFGVVEVVPAHADNDFAMAGALLAADLLPAPPMPWVPRRNLLHHAIRLVGMVLLGAPLLLGGALLDLIGRPLLRRPGGANSVRLLARRGD